MATTSPSQSGNGVAQVAVNPLRAGIESSRITEPCTIVFFGASGDLFKSAASQLQRLVWRLKKE